MEVELIVSGSDYNMAALLWKICDAGIKLDIAVVLQCLSQSDELWDKAQMFIKQTQMTGLSPLQHECVYLNIFNLILAPIFIGLQVWPQDMEESLGTLLQGHLFSPHFLSKMYHNGVLSCV